MKYTQIIPAIALGLACVAGSGLAADNLVVNPSFERIHSPDHPRYFQFYFPQVPGSNPLGLIRGADGMIHLDDSIAQDGTRSLRLSSDRPTRVSVSQNDLPPLAGLKVRLSVWMKAEHLQPKGSLPGALVRMGFASKENPSLDKDLQKKNGYLTAPANTFGWTKLSTTVDVPAEADRIYLECFLWESTGTAWFDQLSVEVIGDIPAAVTLRDPDGMLRYRKANADLLAHPPAPGPRVIFFGDSITDIWKLDLSFPGKSYINRGIGGQDTDQMTARFQQDVLDLHPGIVWFLGGTNDIVKGFADEVILNNVQSMARLCREHGIRFIIASILPVSDYHKDREARLERTKLRAPARILELNRGLRRVAGLEGATYLDLHGQMADASGQMPAEWANDGLHPNAAGYAVMSPIVAKAIGQASDPTKPNTSRH